MAEDPVHPPCFACGKEIPVRGPQSKHSIAEGDYYHYDCFTCEVCDKNVTGADWCRMPRVRCRPCQWTKLCAVCGKVITIGGKKADGKQYHKACFESRGSEELSAKSDKAEEKEPAPVEAFVSAKSEVSEAAPEAAFVSTKSEVSEAAPEAAFVSAKSEAPAAFVSAKSEAPEAAPEAAANVSAGDKVELALDDLGVPLKSETQPVRKEDADKAAVGPFTLQELKDSAEACKAKGIDCSKREAYLSDSQFKTVFAMDRAAFDAQAKWKKDSLKKKVGLF